MDLTARQTDLLSVMDQEFRTGLELAERLYDDRSTATIARVHVTAGQLVDAGLVERTKFYRADRRASMKRLVCYRRTEAGEAAANG
jgi:hypothetical protein